MKNFNKNIFFRDYKDISLFNKYLFVFFSLTILIGLYFGEDSSGGGTIIDFNSTFPMVENPFIFRDDINWHFPLHFYIAGFLYDVLGSKTFLKFSFVISSYCIPILFYICLRNRYSKIDKNNLFLFSLILFLIPALRTSAIWPNPHFTATFFFIGSLIYFVKWEKAKNFKAITTNLFLTIALMSLAVYTRQLYALIFLFLVFIFFRKLEFKTFFKTSLLILLFALPGFYLVFTWPKTLALSFDLKLYNSVLVNTSIISLYLIPFYFIDFWFKKKNFLKENINFKASLFSILTVLILSIYFDYNYRHGGGAFLKLSLLSLDNLYLFYLTSIVGIYLFFLLCKNNLDNFILTSLIIFGFSATVLTQKYFEPMMIILFFIFYKSETFENVLKNKKKITYSLLYFTIYLLSAIVNDIYNFNSSL